MIRRALRKLRVFYVMGGDVYHPLCVHVYTTKNLPLGERTIMCLERFQNSRMEVSYTISLKMPGV